MALLELEQGNVAEAHNLLVRASMFNLTFSEHVSNPMRRDVYREVIRRQRLLQGLPPPAL
jgi:hypothetical protein